MRILMMAINDPAGAVIALCHALERHTRHRARLVTLETRYRHNFTRDIHIPDADTDTIDELGDLLRTSDVFQFHMTADEHIPFGPYLPADFLAGKLVVHHHHGHPHFRGHPEEYREKYRRLKRRHLLVSTPDLLRLLPDAVWQPNAVPQDDPRYLPQGTRPEGPLRIGHSPTNKKLKNTAEFQRVIARLAADSSLPPHEPLLMDDIPHVECLRLKRTADIFFDHMQGYYGLSSLEALSQGVPTVAGLDDWNLRHVEEFAGLPCPWIVARDEDTLHSRLRELLQDEASRAERGRYSRAFMERGWNEGKVAQQLDFFYDRLEA